MSKKTEPRAADMAAHMSEAAAAAEVKTAVPMEREAKTGPVVYCGPSVRGVARQYTVGRSGTAEAILFQKIKSEL